MGRMFGSQTPVYAINNSSVMIRSQDTSYWDNREVFFWTEETCFPWLDYNENLIEDTEKLIDVEEVFSGEVVFSLPAGLRVEESKCLSVWRDGQERGKGRKFTVSDKNTLTKIVEIEPCLVHNIA